MELSNPQLTNRTKSSNLKGVFIKGFHIPIIFLQILITNIKTNQTVYVKTLTSESGAAVLYLNCRNYLPIA